MKLPSDIRQIEMNTRDGRKETYLPVIDLAQAWSLDYRALRSRLHHAGLTEKVEAKHLVFHGALTTLICIRQEDLAQAHVLAITAPLPASKSPTQTHRGMGT